MTATLGFTTLPFMAVQRSPPFAGPARPPASRRRRPRRPGIARLSRVYTQLVGKHLVDLDEAALASAQAELGTATMRDTVNEALRRAGRPRADRVNAALDRLGRGRRPPREEAWR